MVNYTVALVVFGVGVFTTVCVVAYILWGNKKYKNVDPFEDD